MDQDRLVEQIKVVARNLGVEQLTWKAFQAASGIGKATLEKHFDSWSEACAVAGLKTGLGTGLRSPKLITEDECILEMQRVAELLGRKNLSSMAFNSHASFTSKAVISRFGSWHEALSGASG